ncbi:hypothetical protein [Nocardia sp. NPDC050435]|uniref:hypothetical protein n=1 Tax=Nocardia sp. NPDC050435 TaxID=3155040 RepID=UPI0033EC693E
MIEPLIPPQAPWQELLQHGPTSTPRITRHADPDIVYGMCTVGDGGRILARVLLSQLGWSPGLPLLVEPDDGLLLVRPSADGPTVLGPRRSLRVPFRQRRRVGLSIGDRVLLVGRRSGQRLAIHPPAALDELFTPSLRSLERRP